MTTWTVRQSGGDYATLALALSNASTVANDTISIEGTWTIADTSAATVADDNLTIVTDASSRHAAVIETTPSYYRLEVSGAHCITINAGITGCVINGLVIHQDGTGTSDEGIRVNVNTTTTTATIRNCIIYGNSTYVSDQDGIYLDENTNGNMTVTVEQCIIFNFSRGGIHAQQNAGSLTGFTQTLNVNSSTIYGIAGGGQSYQAGVMVWKANSANTITANLQNCLLVGNADSTSTSIGDVGQNGSQEATIVWNVSNTIVSDNSITEVTIDAGSGNLQNRTETANTSPGAGDWVILRSLTYPYDLRLAASGTADNDAYEMHSTATAHSLTIPATDIAGNSRNAPYDCGAWEQSVPAAADSSFLPRSRQRYFANMMNH